MGYRTVGAQFIAPNPHAAPRCPFDDDNFASNVTIVQKGDFMTLKLVSLLLASLIIGANANAQIPVTSQKGGQKPVYVEEPGQRGGNVLYGQTTALASNDGFTFQNFEASFDAFDSELADDFEVPAGAAWTISSVRFLLSATMVQTFNSTISVAFYSDQTVGPNRLPGAAVCTRTNQPISAAFPNTASVTTTIALTSACVLPAGRYWLGLQVDAAFGTAGQFFWTGAQSGGFSNAAWRNPGDGFGSGCTSFAPAATCLNNASAAHFVFELLGSSSAVGGIDITSLPLIRAQGSANSRAPIANVSYSGGAGTVQVLVNGGTSAASNGVTVSSIRNSNGAISANVRASCSSTNATFTLNASAGSDTGSTSFPVTVTPTMSLWCQWWPS
jgi:hypothetical protein